MVLVEVLSAISYQLSAISYQLSAISYQFMRYLSGYWPLATLREQLMRYAHR
ncbi:MAG: hypothetical protein F6J90_03255 [Moorea sp. SIOASIH]|nr:hypothetical protein [Moorena sp. SIOASIH]